jgi:hypothetical protein
VLLKADVSQQKKNEALVRAVSDRNLDIIELLRQYRLKIRSREKRGMDSTPIIGTSKKSHFAR